MITFGLDFAAGAGVGFLVGAFTPAIGRKIKAEFVKLASKLVADAKAEEAKLAADLTPKAATVAPAAKTEEAKKA
jgi:hypothetical protein